MLACSTDMMHCDHCKSHVTGIRDSQTLGAPLTVCAVRLWRRQLAHVNANAVKSMLQHRPVLGLALRRQVLECGERCEASNHSSIHLQGAADTTFQGTPHVRP